MRPRHQIMCPDYLSSAPPMVEIPQYLFTPLPQANACKTCRVLCLHCCFLREFRAILRRFLLVVIRYDANSALSTFKCGRHAHSSSAPPHSPRASMLSGVVLESCFDGAGGARVFTVIQNPFGSIIHSTSAHATTTQRARRRSSCCRQTVHLKALSGDSTNQGC